MDLYPSGYWMMIAEPQGMLQRGLSHPLQNENGAVLWSARAATTSLSLPLFSLTSLDDNTSLYQSHYPNSDATVFLAPPGCGALLLI